MIMKEGGRHKELGERDRVPNDGGKSWPSNWRANPRMNLPNLSIPPPSLDINAVQSHRNTRKHLNC